VSDEDPERPGEETHAQHPGGALFALSLGALGVVYGDIGTSPLYTMRESLLHVGTSREHVLGVLSLIVWGLILVVVSKYLTFVLRADNHGEGGVLALLTLARRRGRSISARRGTLLYLGLAGASLLIGEGTITPAVSVLAAVEGLEVATPAVKPLVVPLAIAIIVVLFAMQKSGTGKIGALFGPAVFVWFLSIAAVGMPWILRHPGVLSALNPEHGVRLLFESWHGFLVLGSVVLCITGGEALYADLGHFGLKPIRLAWYAVVMPCLLMSYFGQGAYVLAHPDEPIGNTFFQIVPESMLYPMVAIATVAAVVASQALISGVYSLTQQAIQLGYLPRMTVIHTSGEMEGRIYVPFVNTALMLVCIGLVLGFRSSSQLAAAYGIAVTGAMSVTSILFVATVRRQWGVFRAALLGVAFLTVDLAFLGANLTKFTSGGWFPMALGAVLLSIMTSWFAGAEAVRRSHSALNIPLTEFLKELSDKHTTRVPGAAVFLARDDKGAPPTLVHYAHHAHSLHERVILVTIQTGRVPRIADAERLEVEDLGNGFMRVLARFGFMESPNFARLLTDTAARGIPIDADVATVFVGHSSVQPNGTSNMAMWRKRLFAFMNRNAQPAALYYGLHPEQVIEIGVRIDI